MASSAPIIACLFVSFLVLSGSGLIGIHLLPPWFVVSVLQLRGAHGIAGKDVDTSVPSGPEGVLIHQLRKVDASREPEKASSLHTAIGNILRASGTQSKEALHHFEAARDAAIQGEDPDVRLAARIDVAEAYIEEGRPLDSQHELSVGNGGLPNHFIEVNSRLNRARGRAKFELGFTDSALQYFEAAQETAVQSEDKVRAVSDIAMARTCLGQANDAIEPLRLSLEILHALRKRGPDAGMPVDLHNSLAAVVHLRLAEAFHSLNNADFAKAHYAKALHLEQSLPIVKAKRVSSIQRSIIFVEKGFAPELHCPTLAKAPWKKVHDPTKTISNPTFMAKIDFLLSEEKYGQVESELKATLSAQERPYKGREASTSLNMLGDLYRKMRDPVKAAKHFRQALHAAIVCCGGSNKEAKTAYEGLRDVKDELPSHDQRVAAAAIDRYLDVIQSGYAGEGEESPVVETSSSEVTMV